LGTSRGPQDPRVMVDRLVAEGVNILFCLGGDGTQRGALTLYQEITRRQLPISIVGIPKTIDNDIPFVRLSFGYVTALEQASQAITCAHVEARDAVNGVGLVKLMGRHAGFIAAGASVISQEVNFTLVPEIKFDLEGEQGLLETLRRRIEAKGHAVIVVAEGAGQHLFSEKSEDHDASGNTLSQDIGEYLRARIKSHFAEHNVPLSLKYIDPSYTIRSVPAVGYDRFLCDQMARHAVHAAMAGKTGLLIGQEHHKFIHVPIQTVVNQTKRMDVHGDLWRAVLQCTGQPRW
jgi:6-phosphofructokinase 1